MIRDHHYSQLYMALDHLGLVEDNDGDRLLAQQLEILTGALDIYKERGRVRGETWAEFDHHDCIHHLSSKLARLKNAAQILAGLAVDEAPNVPPSVVQERTDELISAMEDDALDVINYAAFLVRHLTGRKPVKAIG